MEQYDTKSFIASIDCIYYGRTMPVGCSDPLFSVEKNWLVLNGSPVRASPDSLRLRFEYVGRTHDRLHYKVQGEAPFAGKLGLSTNGYLGLYEIAAVKDFWKVEPLVPWEIQPGSDLRCNLRDTLGRQVGIYLGAYLTVGSELPIDFYLNVLEVFSE